MNHVFARYDFEDLVKCTRCPGDILAAFQFVIEINRDLHTSVVLPNIGSYLDLRDRLGINYTQESHERNSHNKDYD